jgi:hypothetical protein
VPTEQLTQEWLKANAVYDAALQQGNAVNPAIALEQQQMLTTKIFSQFKTTRDCGSGDVTEEVTWIEPLAHCLRHPNSACNRGTTVFNRTYLMPAHSSTADKFRASSRQACGGRTCQAIYLDLGATVLKEGPEEAGQGWFYHTYAKQGIQFDRFLLWEAIVQKPDDVYKHVPKQDLDKYQYYNVPVTTDTKDPSHPVNMLKVGPTLGPPCNCYETPGWICRRAGAAVWTCKSTQSSCDELDRRASRLSCTRLHSCNCGLEVNVPEQGQP